MASTGMTSRGRQSVPTTILQDRFTYVHCLHCIEVKDSKLSDWRREPPKMPTVAISREQVIPEGQLQDLHYGIHTEHENA
ncbi:hypothetical protein N7540_010442 [Penicillium herquei]|nr:hypothetical protein N7540_010442 [Penicillium herquei]